MVDRVRRVLRLGAPARDEQEVLLAIPEPLFAEGVRLTLAATGLRVRRVDIEGRSNRGTEPARRAGVARNSTVLVLDGANARDLDLEALVNKGRETHPDAAIVLILIRDAQEGLLALLDSGVHALLHRQCEPAELVAAVTAAAQGMNWVSPPLATALREQAVADRSPDAMAGLSARELEVLRLLASGASNADVAAALRISENTVRNHVSSVLKKLGASNRTEAVTQAVHRGLVEISR